MKEYLILAHFDYCVASEAIIKRPHLSLVALQDIYLNLTGQR